MSFVQKAKEYIIVFKRRSFKHALISSSLSAVLPAEVRKCQHQLSTANRYLQVFTVKMSVTHLHLNFFTTVKTFETFTHGKNLSTPSFEADCEGLRITSAYQK